MVQRRLSLFHVHTRIPPKVKLQTYCDYIVRKTKMRTVLRTPEKQSGISIHAQARHILLSPANNTAVKQANTILQYSKEQQCRLQSE